VDALVVWLLNQGLAVIGRRAGLRPTLVAAVALSLFLKAAAERRRQRHAGFGEGIPPRFAPPEFKPLLDLGEYRTINNNLHALYALANDFSAGALWKRSVSTKLRQLGAEISGGPPFAAGPLRRAG